MTTAWSEQEVELIIADYFQMLTEELKGNAINKSLYRKALQRLLNNRSEGSIEFKHQNISAVLINFGQPYIRGYKPRFNYQKILADKVRRFLLANKAIENNFKEFAEREVKNALIPDFYKILVDPPNLAKVNESIPLYERRSLKTNYLEREQNNLNLGTSGERLVVEYEKWQLRSLGKDGLADQVEWISQEQGDGAGFDILSKDLDGKDKYIEVKTTKLSKESPFYFSKNELNFSIIEMNKYYLYRVFNFEMDAKMFIKKGSLSSICQYHPISFKGYF